MTTPQQKLNEKDYLEIIKKRFFSKIKKTKKGCWLWTGACNNDGYGNFWVGSRSWGAHRWSYYYHNKKAEAKSSVYICHTCDKPACVNPEHLFEGSSQANMFDAGIKNKLSVKLTRKKVLQIRKLHDEGIKQKVLAKKYGVADTMINFIVRRICWKYI